MNNINPTGLNFEPGQRLSASQLNELNAKVNELVSAVNFLLKTSINVNELVNDFTRVFTLETAVAAISSTKRALGMKIRFYDGNRYLEYSYVGTELADLVFTNLNNWRVIEPNVIDGGTWEWL